MDVLDQLEEYLVYMQELGYTGLDLKESPFQGVEVEARPARPVALRTAPAVAPAPSPDKPKPSTDTKPSRPDAPNLVSIMQTVDLLASNPDTRAQALAVQGAHPTEVLKNLYLTFHHCQACALGTTRNRFVFGEGPANARLMFVGEYPTRIDEASGRPFMDPAGELLNNIIKAMGLTRADVFITNVVKCAPPERLPLPDELDTCAPILERQIDAVKPKVIVALGPTALRFFRGEGVSLVRAHGQFFNWKGHQVMPTYHPDYILRNPRAKRDVWDDLQKVIPLL